jgi:3-phenylpropionate/trans-cinnamate dioxygenase ferredoxin reductase subunit
MVAPKSIVIVGGGQAGGWAARTLRQQGHDGAIVLVGDEPHPPYERPPLSKGLLLGTATPEKTHLFPAAAWAGLNVEHLMGARATSVDRSRACVRLADGGDIPYDRLIVATGGRPRSLPVPGAGLAGIHALRHLADSLAIAGELAADRRVLVVGGGWIGLEVAAAARQRGCSVVLIETLGQLCGRALTREIATHIEALHRRRGVDVRLGRSVVAFDGASRVERANLDDGTHVDVDAAVIGIGIRPSVELAATAGLDVEDGIVVDAFERTSDPKVFAAGDVARFPSGRLGRRVRLESWENAQNQGIHAAKSALGKIDAPYDDVPWFWSDQYDLNLQLLGLPQHWDRVVSRGEVGSPGSLLCYVKSGRIEGAVGFSAGRDMRLVRRIMQSRVAVDPGRLGDAAVPLQELARGGTA